MHPRPARLGNGATPALSGAGLRSPGVGPGAPAARRAPCHPRPPRPPPAAPSAASARRDLPARRGAGLRAAAGPPPAHLRQVLVVEQMRLAGLEAVLTLALVEDVGLEFPARVLLGRRHGRRGGEARRPGPARCGRAAAAGAAACTAGSGARPAQRGGRGMPPAAASQPRSRAAHQAGARPRRSRRLRGRRDAGRAFPRATAPRGTARPGTSAPGRAPGPHRARGPRCPRERPPPGLRGPMDAASWARCLPAPGPASQVAGRCGSLSWVPPPLPPAPRGRSKW